MQVSKIIPMPYPRMIGVRESRLLQLCQLFAGIPTNPNVEKIWITNIQVIIPRDTGHRVKDHIMKMIQNKVLDDKATKNIQ